MDILKRIQSLCETRNWTFNKLAAEAGLGHSALYRLQEKGYEPTLSTIQLICNAFEISLSDFFNDSINLDFNEIILVKNYRELSNKHKSIISNLVRDLK